MERLKKRLVWTLTILVFFFILAAVRTAYIQVYHGEHYARKALDRDITQVSLEDYSRGRILDRNLKPLASSYRSNRIVVFPEQLEEPELIAGGLADITGSEFSAVRSMLSGKKAVVLPFNISWEQAGLIQEAGWKGVLVLPYNFRYGPRPLAVHVLGHLGRIRDIRELEGFNKGGEKTYKLSDWVGRKGLEYFYEKELRGMYPSAFAGIYTDALGKSLPGVPVVVDTKIGDFTRSDLITTIDADIQEIVENVMDRSVKKGAVVVMDRVSGDILAMASRPAYHPNPAVIDPVSAGGDERFVNQALSLFQPGSVFKVVVAAAALSEGAVRSDTSFTCDGDRETPIRCWKKEGHGTITFAEAFAQSCNSTFVKTAMELGSDRLIGYARLLGLENQQIVGYPAEADARQDLNLIAGKYNLANSSVGQGPVLATPVQITAMINTIANGGIFLQPALVKELLPAKGNPVKIEAGEPVRVISPKVAREIMDMMEKVTRSGVGQKAWVEQGGTAGKTGSAELAKSSEVVNAWFSGYGPLDNPRYTITALVRDGNSGGETAAPVFREIMERLVNLN